MKAHTALDDAGGRYQAIVPDTLDLAERAAVALNGLGGMIDPSLGHHMFFAVKYCSNPPYMSHFASSDYVGDPKFAQSLPMMRLMSGSQQHREIEAGHRAALLSRIEDGLYWDRRDPARPWRSPEYGERFYGKDKDEDICAVTAQGRMIRALLSWRELGGDTWDGLIGEMASEMRRLAVVRDDYCYYPDKGGWGAPCTYPRSGWLNTDRVTERDGGRRGFDCGPPGQPDLCRRSVVRHQQ